MNDWGCATANAFKRSCASRGPNGTKILDRHGRLLYEIIDPYAPSSGHHTPVPLERIPLHLRQATIAVEDASFYRNPGVDLAGIVRALWINIQGGEVLAGQFWRLLGRLVPGRVDHIVVYVGPGGRCVESAMLGVVTFEFPDAEWDAQAMASQRGGLLDTLVGVAYPLAGRGLLEAQERAIRLAVARFCLEQAQQRKPYNLNFLDPLTDQAFYCSQLAFCAYLPHGIDLNTGLGVPNLKGSERIIYPQEIWEGCVHQEAPLS